MMIEPDDDLPLDGEPVDPPAQPRLSFHDWAADLLASDPLNAGCYKLDDNGEPVPCNYLECAAQLPDIEKRRVALTAVPGGEVSTVFLGFDHNLRGDGHIPILWETLVFAAGSHNHSMARYASREAALAGHAEIVSEIKAGRITVN